MMIDVLDHIPEALARVSPRDIKQVLPNPTLMHVAGERPEPLFLSTLLHGNETSSLRVLQHLQKRLAGKRPDRSLMIFVGNVDAATEGMRYLDGQPDFNRIWSHGPGRFHAAAENILRDARSRDVFASIDIHNNTGANPIYGCISMLRPADLQLAALFAPIGVYYLNPPTTQSIAFSRLCPSITLECGQSEDPEGIAAATRLVDAVLAMEQFDPRPPPADAVRLYQTVGRVVVDPGCTVSFGEPGADLIMRDDLERLNFVELSEGSVWGHAYGDTLPLRVLDEHEHEVTAEFFQLHSGEVTLSRTVTPAMITPDQKIIRQDCLCYLMEAL